jgi:hypothetical protein
MATSLRSLVDPAVIKKVAPHRLEELLKRTAADWLSKYEFDWTRPADDLATALVDLLNQRGDEVPRELIDVIWYVDQFGGPDAIDRVREVADERRCPVVYDSSMTPADFIVAVWLETPKVLEWVYAGSTVEKCRRFEGTPGCGGDDPTCNESAIQALEARLSEWFDRKSRYAYAKVYPFEDQEGWSFLIRHCQPLQRQTVLVKGVPTSMVVWPEVYDVVRWFQDTDEFGVHTGTIAELREYRAAFGAVLFGDPERFTEAPCYTLAPMLKRGREVLGHGDVEEIHKVTLFGVRFREPRFPGVVFKVSGSTHAWAAWEAKRDSDDLQAPLDATFQVTLRADKEHPMRVTVRPPGTLMAPKRHEGIVRQWLAHAGMLVVDGAHE